MNNFVLTLHYRGKCEKLWRLPPGLRHPGNFRKEWNVQDILQTRFKWYCGVES